MMKMLSTLIFDVDGTLADTERDGHRVAFNRAFAEAGLAWDWDVPLYGKLLAVTGGKERMQFFLDKFLPDWQRPKDLGGFLKSLHLAKTKIYVQMLEAGEIPLRPGVARLLREARDTGLRLAIATTTTPENVTALLRHSLAADGDRWFEVIGAGDIVPAKKPAADIYHWVLDQMRLDPKQALAFEDSENGLIAAKGAALRTLITRNFYTEDHDFSGAVAVLDHLGDPGNPCSWISSPDGVAGSPYVDVSCLQKLTG